MRYAGVVNPCRVCGWESYPGVGLCVGCLDTHEWTRQNRDACNLIHRGVEPERHVSDLMVVLRMALVDEGLNEEP